VTILNAQYLHGCFPVTLLLYVSGIRSSVSRRLFADHSTQVSFKKGLSSQPLSLSLSLHSLSASLFTASLPLSSQPSFVHVLLYLYRAPCPSIGSHFQSSFPISLSGVISPSLPSLSLPPWACVKARMGVAVMRRMTKREKIVDDGTTYNV